MLYEIVCSEFKKKKIEFHNGLNTVLGTEVGDNSIGKSTFLLIVDFVFGGKTYANSLDIIKNVEAHDIYFKFIFDGITYSFARNNVEHKEVWHCDENYKKTEAVSLDDFCNWLDEKYNLQIPHITFRNIVSRYIRVYGKDNANEKLPLHIIHNEKMRDASYSLLKLFELYEPVAQIEQQAKKSRDLLSVFQKAQKSQFIENIGKRQFVKNLKDIENNQAEIETLLNNMEKGLIDVDAEVSEEAIRLKRLLSQTRRMKSRVKIKLDSFTSDLDYKFSITTDDLASLKEFFPNAKIDKIVSIEQFHKNISKVFRGELSKAKKQLESELLEYNNEIQKYENQLSQLVGNPKISKTILLRHSELIRQLDKMTSENKKYTKLQQLKADKDVDKKRLSKIEDEQFAILESNINVEMDKINGFIYSKTANSPILNFEKEKYSFFTPDDTGTGIAYKGLVVFDLAVMHLTKLPIIVHDSIVLKQISDMALEKILELYNKSGGQIFISLDKQSTYTAKSKKILKEKEVLTLSSNGNELFGRAWGRKTK